MSQLRPQGKGDRKKWRKWGWPVFSCKSDDGEADPDEDDDEDAADVVDGDAPTVVVRLLTRLSTWEFFASRFFLQLVYFFSLKNVKWGWATRGEKTDLLLWILVPPSLFQSLQLPLVQQLQDPEEEKTDFTENFPPLISFYVSLHALIISRLWLTHRWTEKKKKQSFPPNIFLFRCMQETIIFIKIVTHASLNWSLRGLPCWTARA